MLQISNVSKSYGANTVLTDVSFILNPRDHLGLVGPNGCGKTTLLRIIARLEPPDRGSVQIAPPDLRLGYLEQGLTCSQDETVGEALGVGSAAISRAESYLAELASALASAAPEDQRRLSAEYAHALEALQDLTTVQPAPHEAEAVLAGLGLNAVSLEMPVASLSGGQKTRLGLARLLLRQPQVLLLDEPTNHLDIEALEWLEDWLQRYPGAALIVSHDRAFLDRSVTGILELDPQSHTLHHYAGNYSAYADQKQAEMDARWRAYADQNEEIARLQAAARRLRGIARPHRGGKGSDGDKFAKGFFANRGRFTVARAKQLEARVERLLGEERIEKPRPTWQMKLDLSTAAASGRDVFSLEGLSIGYGERVLLRDVNQILRLSERVALVGPNGCGKTTLLRTIAGTLPPLAGSIRLGANVRVGYYSQEQEVLDLESTPLATIGAVAALSHTDLRSFLHYFLFSGDEVFTRVANLSYGQRARLILARLVAQGCNLLLLDEPVNHLDIPSRSAFEQAMAAYTGTVLAVVHDRYFIRSFATRLWVVEGDTVSSHLI